MGSVRFLKTGAEAMGAAVRLARVATGRDEVLGCGYHGWLDWCQKAEAAGVPSATRALYGEIPFNDPTRARELIRAAGDRLAAVVFEPVILREPEREWLGVLREETRRAGALLIVDEIKTVCRLAVGGATERYGLDPDLIVMAKAIANGFPLAAVGGSAETMAGVERTWISSTLATEWVALAASLATLRVMVERAGAGAPGPGGRPLLAGSTASPPRTTAWSRVPAVCPRCASWSFGATRCRGGLPGPPPAADSSSSDRLITSCHWPTTGRP